MQFGNMSELQKSLARDERDYENERANDINIGEYLEEKSVDSDIQDHDKELKQENECYRQEVYTLRLKLEANAALEKELQDINETLELSLDQCRTKAERMIAEKEEKHRAAKKEYENHIADLQNNIAQNTQEIIELREQLKKYKAHIIEQPKYLPSAEDILVPYKERIEELVTLFEDEAGKREQLEERLVNMKNQNQEFQEILKVTKEQLTEKTEILENTREELAVKRMELESLKMIPAIYKGNSLFAEVEDRRQILSDRMKILQHKYNEAKQAIKTKSDMVRILETEKTVMVRDWEADIIDAQQENTDLLDKYKARISELEDKFETERKRNSEEKETQITRIGFNYAQQLLAVKKNELKQLNEKLEKQSMELLIQQEANHDISKQFRYWRCKARSLEAQISITKTGSETELTTDDNNKDPLETINNRTITDNVHFQETCNLKIMSNDLIPENSIYERKSTKISQKSTIGTGANEENKYSEKVLQFATDIKNVNNKYWKKRTKQDDYPIITISDDLSS